ncbi:MAG: redoxin domain-containing protein [Candidatus Pseudobacter hemicellulosilyticus]|uniref:Redoxin domain-containing protein n=1 Tax=Candidatus Pseudobacter hemicellulosilyticus TaxID=3121375 RepID=A0AAJ5WSC5_9BACT|nr:MAG: redoxin domain-containing protein [Pseudobacter sp.]
MVFIFKYISCFSCALLTVLVCIAQKDYSRIRVGEKVPELELRNIINFSTDKVLMSEFKGKLLILDFWNIGCSVCIANFPKMEKLQKEFGNDIQILLVNTLDSKELLKKRGFPQNTRSKILNETNLPIVIGDTILNTLFPHEGEPFHVWIGNDGVVKGMTNYLGTTGDQIRNYLEGKEVSLLNKLNPNDFYLNNKSSILKEENSKILQNILASSILTKNLAMMGWDNWIKDSTQDYKLVGYRYSGTGIQLLSTALINLSTKYRDSAMFLFYPDRIVLDVRRPDKFVPPHIGSENISTWMDSNYYYYEIRLPSDRMSDSERNNRTIIAQAMLEDLQRYLFVTASIQERYVPCYVLKRISNKKKYVSQSKTVLNYFYESGVFKIENSPISVFTSALRYALGYKGMPIIDETEFGDSVMVDLEINGDLNKLEDVRKGLAKYDMDLVEETRLIDVVVVNDRLLSKM